MPIFDLPMMRAGSKSRCLLLAFIGSIAACHRIDAAPPARFYRVVDLTANYSDFFDRTRGMEANSRVAAFKREMDSKFPDFYSRQSAPWLTREQYDASIAHSFEAFPGIRTQYERKAASFITMLDPALASFRHVFSDMRPIGDIHLVHSIGAMDGGTRQLGAANFFIFGADVMARVHRFDDETPFFHHELFHVYHRGFFSDGCEQLWCSLWMEGLAVLAASTLTPDASDDQLLLTSPQPIRAKVDSHFVQAICAASEKLASETPEDYQSFFGGQQLSEALPPRFGYYVGYLIGRESLRSRSLNELAHLNVAQARPIVEASLLAMAVCPTRKASASSPAPQRQIP
ncbi:MAG: hypothetical protein ABI579_08990 [Candidatus Sumerlaeota bacterium]